MIFRSYTVYNEDEIIKIRNIPEKNCKRSIDFAANCICDNINKMHQFLSFLTKKLWKERQVKKFSLFYLKNVADNASKLFCVAL